MQITQKPRLDIAAKAKWAKANKGRKVRWTASSRAGACVCKGYLLGFVEAGKSIWKVLGNVGLKKRPAVKEVSAFHRFLVMSEDGKLYAPRAFGPKLQVFGRKAAKR